jgi:zinc/manganese transport system substrate-binding protein
VLGSRAVRRLAPALVLVALSASGPACDKSGGPSASGARGGGGSAKLTVVAAENVWGSIASQLGGSKVRVSSIIVNPDTDPHTYEPTAQDARILSSSQLAIVNGIGYDNWAARVLGASRAAGRIVLDVGRVLGLRGGENPHQWYSPAHVLVMVERITAAYQRLDPSHASYFAQREHEFLNRSLSRYDALRREIRARFAGVPIGYSESVFEPLGEDLHLELLTPYSFAKAIAEGTDVTAQDKQTVDTQASRSQIKVWVLNSQNVTPDVQRVSSIVRERHIPTVSVTETLTPSTASFEQWQVAELEALRAALSRATGR